MGGLHILNLFIKDSGSANLTASLIRQTCLPLLGTQVLTACWNKGSSVHKHNTAKLLSTFL